MFWIKKKDLTDAKLSQMHNLLARSFTNVKRDTQNLFQWMNYFYQKNLEQENIIRQLYKEISYIPKRPEDIKRIIDSYYSYENITNKIQELDKKIDALVKKEGKIELHEKQPELEFIEKRLAKLEQKKASLRERIVKRITRNSKEYVKSIILSYIKKYSQIGALQLKDMIVEEQSLCSKSSFYRILEEIESLEEIGVVKRGKEKYYLSKTVKQL